MFDSGWITLVDELNPYDADLAHGVIHPLRKHKIVVKFDLVNASAGTGFLEIAFLFRVAREVIADEQQLQFELSLSA